MIKNKFIKIAIISFILLSILYLILNIVLVAYYKPILSKINNDKLNIQIGEINKLLIPFYIETSYLIIKYEKQEVKIKNFKASISIFDFFKNKPFIDIDINDTYVKSKINKKSSDTQIDFSFFKNLSYIKKIKIDDSKLDINDEDFKANINLKNILYSKGIFNIVLNNSKIQRDNLSETISGNIAGSVSDKDLSIKQMNIEGSSIYVSSKNFYVSKSNLSGKIQGEIGDKFIRIIDSKLSGSVKFKLVIKDNNLTLAFATEHMTFDKQKILLEGRAKGDLKNKIIFNIDKLAFLDYSFKVSGYYDTQSTFTETNVKFLKNLDIYKGHGWYVFIKDLYVKGKIKDNNLFATTTVVAEDIYKVSCNASFDLKKKLVYLNNLIGKSEHSYLKGSAVSNFKGITIKGSGHVKDNAEVVKILNLKHEADVSILFDVDFHHLSLKGEYSTKKAQQFYNVNIDEAYGDFDLDLHRVKFTTFAKLDEGQLNIIGEVDFDKNISNFEFDNKRVYFSSLLDYFKVKTTLNIPISGKAFLTIDNNKITANGEIKAFYKNLLDNDISFHFKKGILYVDKIRIDKYKIKHPVKFNFNSGKIYGYFHLHEVNYLDIPELNNLYFNVSGKISEPDISGKFLLNTKLAKFPVKYNGHLDAMHFTTKKDNISFNSVVNLFNKSIKAEILLNNYQLKTDKKNININGEISLLSNDFENFKGNSNLIKVNIDKEELNFKDIQFDMDYNSIYDFSALSYSQYWNNLLLENVFISKTGIQGDINFDKIQITIENSNILPKGQIDFNYDYKKINLNGDVFLNGALNIEKYKLKIPFDNAHINFNNSKVAISSSGKELDMNYKFNFFADDFLKIFDGHGYFEGKNIYFLFNNTSILSNISATYKNRLLSVDINLLKADIDTNLSKFKNDSTSNTINLPFDIKVDFKSKNNIELKSEFYHAILDFNFNIFYDHRLKTTDIVGKINSVKSNMYLSGSEFFIKKGFVSFKKATLPYIYLLMQGSGEQSSVTIKIDGFLPNYNIELINRNPNNASFLIADPSLVQENPYARSNKNLVLNLMNGAISQKLVSVSERLFGINRIGFEENQYRGQNNNYIKVGKKFSDRLEIKYIIATGRDDDNAIVGEYVLLDWLKVLIYSSADGGNGAGFSFFINF